MAFGKRQSGVGAAGSIEYRCAVAFLESRQFVMASFDRHLRIGWQYDAGALSFWIG
jgi:hypothetical protein